MQDDSAAAAADAAFMATLYRIGGKDRPAYDSFAPRYRPGIQQQQSWATPAAAAAAAAGLYPPAAAVLPPLLPHPHLGGAAAAPRLHRYLDFARQDTVTAVACAAGLLFVIALIAMAMFPSDACGSSFLGNGGSSGGDCGPAGRRGDRRQRLQRRCGDRRGSEAARDDSSSSSEDSDDDSSRCSSSGGSSRGSPWWCCSPTSSSSSLLCWVVGAIAVAGLAYVLWSCLCRSQVASPPHMVVHPVPPPVLPLPPPPARVDGAPAAAGGGCSFTKRDGTKAPALFDGVVAVTTNAHSNGTTYNGAAGRVAPTAVAGTLTAAAAAAAAGLGGAAPANRAAWQQSFVAQP